MITHHDDATRKQAAVDDGAQLEARAVTLTLFGQTVVGKKRASNEDAFLISDLSDAPPIHSMTSPVSLAVTERGALIAVSDGMGGAQAGEIASALVLSSLWQGMTSVQATGPDTALRAAIERANREVFDAANATGRAGMGATLTALLFWGPHVYVAEIGDSRAYLLRGRSMAQLTRDQTYVQQLIDAGGLTPEEAEKSDLSNVILQAMGLAPQVDIALKHISLRKSDRFVVCSDGLSGPLADREMQDIIAQSPTLESACATLIKAAVDKGGEDDITVVLAEVGADAAHASTGVEGIALDTTQPMAPEPKAGRRRTPPA